MEVKTAKEWLEKWDAGEPVWTIKMGGIGPGYEQCIHIVCAEFIRSMIALDINSSLIATDMSYQEKMLESCESTERIEAMYKSLGLSGAQVGAGKYLAVRFFGEGVDEILSRPEVKDRKILVNKTFPQFV